MKPIIYLVAAIFLMVCVYAFIQYVPISYKKVPYDVEQAGVEVDGPLKKAIDKKSTLLCDIESFWSKYDIWGDTDTVYSAAENDQAAENKADEGMSCDEQRDDAVSQ